TSAVSRLVSSRATYVFDGDEAPTPAVDEDPMARIRAVCIVCSAWPTCGSVRTGDAWVGPSRVATGMGSPRADAATSVSRAMAAQVVARIELTWCSGPGAKKA